MHFVPFQSVGLFKLGDNADSYTDILQKYEMEKDEDGSIFYLLKALNTLIKKIFV